MGGDRPINDPEEERRQWEIANLGRPAQGSLDDDFIRMARDPIDVLRTGMLYFKSDKKEDSHPRLSVDPVETARVRALINNPPPNEAMMATQRDRYQPADDLYPSTELPPYDPMKANQHALLMEALRRMGALPEGTQPSF